MRQFVRWVLSNDSPRKSWLARQGIDWFGLIIFAAFFASMLLVRVLGG